MHLLPFLVRMQGILPLTKESQSGNAGRLTRTAKIRRDDEVAGSFCNVFQRNLVLPTALEVLECLVVFN